MISIRIFDLQKVGLGNERQRCRIHRFMAALWPTRWLIDDGFISKPFTLDNKALYAKRSERPQV